MTPAGAAEDCGEAGRRAGPRPSATPSMHRKRHPAIEREPKRGGGSTAPREEPSEDVVLLDDIHREPSGAGQDPELSRAERLIPPAARAAR